MGRVETEMSALIWTAGGAAIGIGHLTRCQALAAALAGKGRPPVIVMEGEAGLAGYLAVDGVEVEACPDRAALWAAMARRIGASGLETVILDRPGLQAKDVERLRGLRVKRIVLLSSEGLTRLPVDLAIVDDPAIIEIGPPAARRVEAGPGFHMVRPAILALRPPEPWSARAVRRVLIALGGADPGGLTEPLTAALAAAAPELRLDAVMGPAWSASRRAAFMVEAGETGLLDAPGDLGPAMLAADAVITLGGRSSYEAFALGRPALCVGWGAVAGYARGLARAGLAAALDAEPALAARQALAAFSDPARLAARAARAFKAINPDAAARVAALCMEAS